MKTSVSIKLNENTEALSPHLEELNAKFGKRLAELDTNNDGKIDRVEILSFIDEVVRQEKKIKYLKRLLIASLIGLILFALTTFGVVWAVVVLSRKVTTQPSSVGAVLVDSSSGEPLRAGKGLLQVSALVRNDSAAAGLFDNSTMSTTGRKLLSEGDDSNYLGDAPAEDVINGCRLLLSGERTFTTTPGGEDGNSDGVYETTVLQASLANCRRIVASGSVEGFEAYLIVSDGVGRVYIICQNSDTCSVLHSAPRGTSSPTPAPAGEGGNSGRRLASYTSSATQSSHKIYFGDSLSVSCDRTGKCSALEEISALESPLYGFTHNRGLKGAQEGDKVCISEGQGRHCTCNGGCDEHCGDAYLYCKLYNTDSGRSYGYSNCAGDGVSCPAGTTATYGGGLCIKTIQWCSSCQPCCFSSAATALLVSGKRVPVKDLKVGDVVQTVNRRSGKLSFSPIYSFVHRDESKEMIPYTKITLDSNKTITASGDHYLFISSIKSAVHSYNWKHRQAVVAGNVKVGDKMWWASEQELHLATVTNVQTIQDQGKYAPLTLDSTIVVDGVVASVHAKWIHTDAIDLEVFSHHMSGAFRFVWHVFPQFWITMDARQWAEPFASALSRATGAVLRAASLA